jgi:hypothetical protein
VSSDAVLVEIDRSESVKYKQLADELRAESVSGDAARELITSAGRRARAFLDHDGEL